MSNTKFALVTGAGSGVGRASAMALAAAGWDVALVGRRHEALEETAGGNTNRFLILPADVSDPAAVETVFATVKERWGRLDLLFNNAGGGNPSKPIDELSIEQWQDVVGVNLMGSVYCARAAFGIMRHQSPQGGRIINNGSISAHTPRMGSSPYTTTKHAITGLTKSLSLDGRAFDIACCQIDIGNAETPMTERMTRGVPQPGGAMMVEPRMDVKHVADMVLHMASLPLEANIQFVMVMATKMPFLGRG